MPKHARSCGRYDFHWFRFFPEHLKFGYHVLLSHWYRIYSETLITLWCICFAETQVPFRLFRRERLIDRSIRHFRSNRWFLLYFSQLHFQSFVIIRYVYGLIFIFCKNFLCAARSSSAFSSGHVGLQAAQAPVSLEALNFCLSALRIGG